MQENALFCYWYMKSHKEKYVQYSPIQESGYLRPHLIPSKKSVDILAIIWKNDAMIPFAVVY